jgi:hypothetical protein
MVVDRAALPRFLAEHQGMIRRPGVYQVAQVMVSVKPNEAIHLILIDGRAPNPVLQDIQGQWFGDNVKRDEELQ